MPPFWNCRLGHTQGGTVPASWYIRPIHYRSQQCFALFACHLVGIVRHQCDQFYASSSLDWRWPSVHNVFDVLNCIVIVIYYIVSEFSRFTACKRTRIFFTAQQQPWWVYSVGCRRGVENGKESTILAPSAVTLLAHSESDLAEKADFSFPCARACRCGLEASFKTLQHHLFRLRSSGNEQKKKTEEQNHPAQIRWYQFWHKSVLGQLLSTISYPSH